MSRRSERYAPYPELVETEAGEGPYEILDSGEEQFLPSQGMVDMVNRKLFVPLAAGGVATIRHEMGHVRWSPTEHPELDFDRRIFLCVEDARVNMGLDAFELPVHVHEDERKYVADLAVKDLGRGDPGAFALRAVASLGTNVGEDVLRAAESASAEIRETVEGMVAHIEAELLRGRLRLGGPVSTVEHVVVLARELAQKLAALGWLPQKEAPGLVCCAVHGRALRGRPSVPRHPFDGDDVPSGRMKVVCAPLPIACRPPRGGARRVTSVSEGSVVRAPHRWSIDQAIFRRVRRERRGTVLIDTSGSMSFTANDLDRILGPAPAAIQVAIYSGAGEIGELRIVARGGRRARAAHLQPFAGGNVVDAPALRWLARQPAPRVWLSDNGVSGVNDRACHAIRRECKRIRRRAGIQRVTTPEEAARALSR